MGTQISVCTMVLMLMLMILMVGNVELSRRKPHAARGKMQDGPIGMRNLRAWSSSDGSSEGSGVVGALEMKIIRRQLLTMCEHGC